MRSRCADNSSPSKAARAPASRPRRRCWRSGCKSLGIGVVLTREPGGSPGAEIIRHVLLSGAAKPLGPEAEAILFAAARDDHVRNTIEPALDARPLGDLRPLHRFDARLSGRARQRRPEAPARARAGHRRRPQARPHLHPRRAGRDRARARQQAARRRQRRPLRGGIGRRFTRSCARPSACSLQRARTAAC